jgi:hypothetical protein
MKNIKIFAQLLLAITSAATAYSQTWVSNTGNDANPCTMTAPCRTFQQAVNLTSTWGQVGVLNAGDYGPMSITKSIRIEGSGLASSTATSGNAIFVNTPAGSVVQLHGLNLHGNGAQVAIQSQGAGSLDIDNVQITGFHSNCIQVVVVVGPVNVVIKDTTIENCSGAGIYLSPDASYPSTAKIVNSHVRYANGGLSVATGAISIAAYDSTFSSPGQPNASSPAGISVSSENSVLLDNCEVSDFGVGIFSEGQIQVSRSSLVNNWTALIASEGGTIVSNGNNSFLGNNSNGSFTSTVALK